MPDLSTIDGRSLVPDLSNALNTALGGLELGRERRAEQELAAQTEQDVIDIQTGDSEAVVNARARLLANDPQKLQVIEQIMASDNAAIAKRFAQANEARSRFALNMKGLPPEQVRKEALKFGQQMLQQGFVDMETLEAGKIMQLANETDPDQQDLILRKLENEGLDIKTIVDNQKPQTETEKLIAANLITQEEARESERNKALGIKSDEAVKQELDKLQKETNIKDNTKTAQLQREKTRKDISKLDKEISGEGGLDIKDESTIRKEFTAASKDFVKIKDAFAKISNASETAAGDLNLIFGFMKVLDPGSTVREGEFANAQNTGGVPQRIRAQYNNIINGARLSQEQREAFKTEATNLFNTQLQSQVELEEQFTDLTIRKGGDPRDTVVDFVGRFRDLELGGDDNSLEVGEETQTNSGIKVRRIK